MTPTIKQVASDPKLSWLAERAIVVLENSMAVVSGSRPIDTVSVASPEAVNEVLLAALEPGAGDRTARYEAAQQFHAARVGQHVGVDVADTCMIVRAADAHAMASTSFATFYMSALDVIVTTENAIASAPAHAANGHVTPALVHEHIHAAAARAGADLETLRELHARPDARELDRALCEGATDLLTLHVLEQEGSPVRRHVSDNASGWDGYHQEIDLIAGIADVIAHGDGHAMAAKIIQQPEYTFHRWLADAALGDPHRWPEVVEALRPHLAEADSRSAEIRERVSAALRALREPSR